MPIIISWRLPEFMCRADARTGVGARLEFSRWRICSNCCGVIPTGAIWHEEAGLGNDFTSQLDCFGSTFQPRLCYGFVMTATVEISFPDVLIKALGSQP